MVAHSCFEVAKLPLNRSALVVQLHRAVVRGTRVSISGRYRSAAGQLGEVFR
jgi:hypothetical protein